MTETPGWLTGPVPDTSGDFRSSGSRILALPESTIPAPNVHQVPPVLDAGDTDKKRHTDLYPRGLWYRGTGDNKPKLPAEVG